jgi:hypothetical protein
MNQPLRQVGQQGLAAPVGGAGNGGGTPGLSRKGVPFTGPCVYAAHDDWGNRKQWPV